MGRGTGPLEGVEVSLPSIDDAFRGRSVLVTGHTGFKGSWLTLWLAHLGARVTGYSLAPPTTPSNFEVSAVRDVLAEHYEDDIRNIDALRAALRSARPEIVLHLAAQSLVRQGYSAPYETFDVNVMGTIALLDAVREMGSQCAVVVVTSDKCYDNRGQAEGFCEGDPLGGHDPYSASKGAAELATAAYRDSFFPPDQIGRHGITLASARAGNVIGGGDWAPNRIVTDIILSLVGEKPIPVRNPHSVRPWQHVLEPLSGYLSLAASLMGSDAAPQFCGPWNFGPNPDEELTVAQLVEAACAAWGSGSWKDVSNADQPPEETVLRLSSDQATRALGWKPRWQTSEAVMRTVAWYRRYYDGPEPSMRNTCIDEIDAYSSHA